MFVIIHFDNVGAGIRETLVRILIRPLLHKKLFCLFSPPLRVHYFVTSVSCRLYSRREQIVARKPHAAVFRRYLEWRKKLVVNSFHINGLNTKINVLHGKTVPEISNPRLFASPELLKIVICTVVIATGHGLDGRGSNTSRSKIFFISSIPDLRRTWPPIQ
jgi:hypothetical protein